MAICSATMVDDKQLERTLMDLKLEVVPIPVTDVDAAKAFYTEQVGFNLDHDIRPGMACGLCR